MIVDEKVDNRFLLKTNVKDKYRDFLLSKGRKKWVFIGKNVKMAENHESVFRHFCSEGLVSNLVLDVFR